MYLPTSLIELLFQTPRKPRLIDIIEMDGAENLLLRSIFVHKRKELENGEYYMMRSFMICILHLITLRNEIMEDETGRTCNRYGEVKCAYKILVGKPNDDVKWTSEKRVCLTSSLMSFSGHSDEHLQAVS
jgi:hypothetical protein